MAPTGGTAGVGPKSGVALREASARGDVTKVGFILQASAASINEPDEVSPDNCQICTYM